MTETAARQARQTATDPRPARAREAAPTDADLAARDYDVAHAFAHEGTFYNRDTADAVRTLDAELLRYLLDTGKIVPRP